MSLQHDNPVFAAADVEAAAPREALLAPVPFHQRVVVNFESICAFVPVLVTPGATEQEDAGAGEQQRDVEAGRSGRGCLPGQQSTSTGPKERQVLYDISGRVQPGHMLALMGPSGSGKSSLLTILGGRNSARITGKLEYNGKALSKPMKRRMGFVTQDDLLFGELTTYETLYYAALLRLPKTWSRAQKLERVDMVLRGLGLDKCRDTIIGNHMMRGVSGGERKRVSIGHELLINPAVILLDEPTSGLDSTTALKLVHTLRALSTGGRTVIASIHQPSSRLYKEFDKLMLLAEGHCMFYGDAHATPAWFELQSVPVPFGISMPDHLLDLACGDLTGRTPQQQAEALLRRLVQAFERRPFGTGHHGIQPQDLDQAAVAAAASSFSVAVPQQRQLAGGSDGSSPDEAAGRGSSFSSPAGSGAGGAKDSSRTQATDATGVRPDVGRVGAAAVVKEKQLALHPSKSSASETEVQDDVDRSEAGEEDADGGKWGASWLQQVAILTSRSMRTRRFESLSVQRFAEVILTALLSGVFWYQVGAGTLTKSSINDVNGLMFFMVIFMAFSVMFLALFTFPADFQMLLKERMSGAYRLSSYYASRTLSDIPMDCLMPTIFTGICYGLAGLRPSAGAFFGFWLGLLLSTMVAQSIGLLLSASIDNGKTLLSTASVLMLAWMLIGGFFVQNVPTWIAWAKYLSFVRYGYMLLQKVQFGGRGMDCGDYYQANPTAPPGMTWCPVVGSGLLPTTVNDPVTLEVCVLLLWLIVVRIGVYLALAHRTSFKAKHA